MLKSGVRTNPHRMHLPPHMDITEPMPERLSSVMDLLTASQIEKNAFDDKAETAPTLFVVSKVGDLIGVKANGELVAVKSMIYGTKEVMSMSTSVHEDNLGQGHGTRLARNMEKIARENGVHRLFALVAPENGAQLSSYVNKQAWAITDYKPGYYGDEGDFGFGGDRFIVSKDLTSQERKDPIFEIEISDTAGLKLAFESGHIGVRLIRGETGNSIGFAKATSKAKRPKEKGAFSSQKEVIAAQKLEAKVRDPPSSVFFLRSMEMVGEVMVERDEDKLTGFVGVMAGKKDDAYIHGPFTDGKDATPLLEKAESKAKAMGASSTWTVTPASDEKGLAMLSAAGYKITEKADGLYGGKDLLCLAKDLT